LRLAWWANLHTLPPHSPPPEAKEADGSKEETKQADAAIDAAFERFWRVYPKHMAKLDAIKAFAKAIKDGADAEVIIAGAARYATARSGQDEKYTKLAGNWLRDGRWLDEPAAAAGGTTTIDQDGNVVSPPRASDPNRRRTWAEVAQNLDRMLDGQGGSYDHRQ
jgi:hypothetical protein